uniref:NADH dehydrogenase subunit 5 n=1 Tax=Stereocaulon pileatum TaxID=209148 RepID=UPI0022FD7B18|nr:NADH dehydrogenase subunit 5 [Stereocaulon pileatum]WBP63151.1 NADH dehydrogenase subunit 5 [Stereocaulon pileatum]
MYLAIILLPMLGSVVSGFLGRKVGVSGAQLITCLCVMVTTALAIIGFIEAGLNNTPVSILLFKWVDLESLNVLWGFNYDSLTASMLIPVLIVSSLVHIYSIGYMSHDPHNQRFFSYLSLFTFMMIILVTASNFLLMFVGWEGVGVCSYLLVSFWFTRIAANQSSISAFLTNRVGDCFLTLGMFAMILTFGSLDYSTVFSLAPYVSGDVVTVVGICLLIGAMAKSSQIGLHVWLPLAMEGPTPVSALIHAATMVTAGVYLLMRASPVIEYSSTVLILCLWIGSITTVFSSLIGLFQQDIKKVIAYSTMSQLGMMVIAVGLSSYNIALFHLVNHAFYKGLLFLGAGAVIHAVTDNQDFRKYGGLIGFLPLTYSVMLIASLSLVAFPFMTGFYSKDFILESAYGQFHFYSLAVYFIATIGATFTTLYSVKVLYLTFITNANGPLVNYKKAHEGDVFMSLPLMILAVFSIFFGYITIDIFIGLASGFYADNSLFMHPLHEIMLETEFAVPNIFKLLPLLLTVILSAVSLILSEYLSNLLVKFKFTRLGYNTFSLFNQRFLIELFYNKYITRSILNLGGQTTKVLDKGSVELLGPYGLEKGLLKLSKGLSSLDTGVITSYALYILIGLILYILMPYICIEHIYILLSIMLILSAITIIIMSSYEPSTFNTSPVQSG